MGVLMDCKRIDLTEFNKLEQMLKDARILYVREDSSNSTPDFTWEFHQLRCPKDILGGEKWLWDVVCNTGSYGYEKGLLEIWGANMDEPEGWLRAEECLEKIESIMKAELIREIRNYERNRKEEKS